MGKIYYLMGKSASGKDHIYENLIQETALDLKPFVLYTTRPIRSGEQDGREYFFVDEKRLSELREAGKIIEERMYSRSSSFVRTIPYMESGNILRRMTGRLILRSMIISESGHWNRI